MDVAYQWCLQCHRAYPTGQFRWTGGRQRCAYPDCDGLYFGALSWAYLRTLPPDGPRLPALPVARQVYRLELGEGALHYHHR